MKQFIQTTSANGKTASGKMPLGNHIHRDGKKFPEAIARDIARAKSAGVEMKSGQIFVIGPQSTRENLDEEEKKQLKSITDGGFQLIVHSSYLSNPWGRKPGFGAHLVKRELEICDEIGAKGLVVHLARKPPDEIADMIPKLLKSSPKTRLFLEIESYKADDNTYETTAKISRLVEKIVAKGVSKEAFGICIDTAHIWAAGVDISDYSSMRLYIENIKQNEVELMVHLNDQIWALGSGRDEHAPLAYGTIWGIYNPDAYIDGMERKDIEDSGLAAMLDWVETEDICVILERKPDKPKINSRPLIDNILSDYTLIGKLEYFRCCD